MTTKSETDRRATGSPDDGKLSLAGVTTLLFYETRVAALLDALHVSDYAATIEGMPYAGHAPLVAALAAELTRPLLVVTAHPERVMELVEGIRLWAPEEVDVYPFPALEALPYEQSDPEEAIIQRRQAMLVRLARRPAVKPRQRSSGGGRPGHLPVVICPARALLQPLMSPQDFATALQEIGVGRRLHLRTAVDHWLDFGYSEVPMVERAGQFARRGGIVDIYPAGEPSPVRIELFGDEVESLRRFDVATQRSTVERTATTVTPLYPFTRAAIPSALERLRAVDLSHVLPHIQQKWQEDIARLHDGLHIEGLDFYASFLLSEPRQTVVDYLPADTLLVVDEPEACLQAVDELRAQMDEIHQELTGRVGVASWHARPAHVADQVLTALGSLQRLEWRQRYASMSPHGDWPWPQE